jgi:glutamyl-tRNA synthetase
MVRVRFAPSPTGYLHVGNARTALFNYLFARRTKGTFILRIEDTDLERSERAYENAILEDLKWFGITWDEGPFRQSERTEIYRTYAEELMGKGLAYKCFCTKERLEEMRSTALARGYPPRYDGTCRNMPAQVAASLENQGAPFVVRFKSFQTPVMFRDEIRGEIGFPAEHVDDFIILRQDRTASYNFAVTVDDMSMEVSHVIRGADHVSNTPKQVMLFRALGALPPVYSHHSLLTGLDRRPLSKREGATRIREFREMGILPGALFNYLGVNGRNVGKELMETGELIGTFALQSLSSSDSVFDMEKLLWFNRHYMRQEPLEVLLSALGMPPEEGPKVAVLRENAATLNEMRQQLAMFEGSDTEKDGMAYLSGAKMLPEVLGAMEDLLSDSGGQTFDSFVEGLVKQTGMKKREVLMVSRILLTGRRSGPPLQELFPLIPRRHIFERIQCLREQFLAG